MTTCSACQLPAVVRGFCEKHFNAACADGVLDEKPIARSTCTIDGCDQPLHGRGRCSKHYQTAVRGGDIAGRAGCTVPGCDGTATSKGHCGKHAAMRRRNGDPLKRQRQPKGSGTVSGDGYRILARPGHPNAAKNGQIFEHRLVMSESLGRPLLAHETPHHKNGDRLDNRLTKGHELGGCQPTCCNLELWSKSQPSGQRVVDKLAWAHALIALYEPH